MTGSTLLFRATGHLIAPTLALSGTLALALLHAPTEHHTWASAGASSGSALAPGTALAADKGHAWLSVTTTLTTHSGRTTLSAHTGPTAMAAHAAAGIHLSAPGFYPVSQTHFLIIIKDAVMISVKALLEALHACLFLLRIIHAPAHTHARSHTSSGATTGSHTRTKLSAGLTVRVLAGHHATATDAILGTTALAICRTHGQRH